jgi:hypothetical protein
MVLLFCMEILKPNCALTGYYTKSIHEIFPKLGIHNPISLAEMTELLYLGDPL